MTKYKEIKIDMTLTPELILEQLLIQQGRKVEPFSENILIENKNTQLEQ